MAETETRVRRRFDVWNEVPLVPQLTGMSCWAAAAAMVIGWRDRVVVDPRQVARGAGSWQAYRGGLHPADVGSLARAWGLTLEEGESWTLEGLRQTLARHGPVWLGEASPGLHSVVVAGMHGDGTPDGTLVRVNDPWPVGRGERYSLPWRTLSANFQAAGDLLGVRAHVLHAGGRRGSSRSRETRVTRSRISLPLSPTREVAMRYGNGWSPPHPEDYASAGGPATAVAASAMPAGERYVNTTAAGGTDPLRGHAGGGENLYLVWNGLPDDCREVDVVVHLHGYHTSPPNAGMTRIVAGKSGLRLHGRPRPTLGIVPRGRKITDAEYQAALAAYNALPEATRRTRPPPRADAYTFPALLAGSGAGLARLIEWSLAWLGREVLRLSGGAPARARLILTAHSGGGSPLNALLGWRASNPACNPHEVHVFDALYGGTAGLEGWAAARLAADRALPAAELRTRGGGLRILYGGGTRTSSERVGGTLPAAGAPLRDAYRAELTVIDHDDVPSSAGPGLLQDVRANVPLAPATAPRARGHGLDADAGSLGAEGYTDGYGEDEPAAEGYALAEEAHPSAEEEDGYGPAAVAYPLGEEGYPAGEDDEAGYPVAASLGVDDDVRAWLAAGTPAARAPLAASVAAWVAATDRSGVELISDPARRRHFLSEVDWSRTDFPGNDANRSAEPEALFTALARAVPERRVTSIRYHDVDGVVQPVPGDTGHRLYPEAKDAFVRMRDAARADGVTLRIGSAWRSRARQRAAAARNPNPNAVAQRTSAHSYGLAVDLLLSVPGLRVSEITTRPMANIIAMYRSPVYKWMALHGREYGWFPYRREPWHWEFNPSGFQARFAREGSGATGQAYGAPLGLFERYPSSAVLDAPGGCEDDYASAGTETYAPGLAYDDDPATGDPDAYAPGLGWDDEGTVGLQAAPATRPAPAARDWPRVSADDRLLYVMERLVNQYGMPVNGAAGLVGNLWAESGVIPSRIEGSAGATPLRAPAFGGGVRDFTADEVMNRDSTARRGPRLPGIGLAQWTAPARRAGLFRHTFQGRTPGSGILFDMDAQIDYLATELQRSYAAVWRLLTRSGVTVNDAADEVVYRFEVPGSVLENGRLLPRADSRVQAVFTARRDSAQRALRVYRAAHPVTGGAQTAPPAAPATPAAPVAPAVDWCAMRQAIATTARAEERRWTAPNGGKILESAQSQLPILRQYWGAVPGLSTAQVNTAADQSAANHRDYPWSAALICYVMHTAGVQRAHGFNFGPAHMHYIVGALRNRERSDTTRPFWLVDHIEIVNEARVEPGDLLCMNRVANGSMTTHTYSSLRRAFWENGNENRAVQGLSSHCTLVVGIGQDAQGRFVQTIGGNEGQSVRLNHYGRIALNASGGIASPAAHNIFGLIKMTGCNR